MLYIYAALLLHKAGQKVEEASVKKVLEAAGIKVDDNRVRALIAALNGVDIEAAIKEAAVVSAAPAAAPSAARKKEEKKEEEKKSAEEAAAGLGALFG